MAVLSDGKRVLKCLRGDASSKMSFSLWGDSWRRRCLQKVENAHSILFRGHTVGLQQILLSGRSMEGVLWYFRHTRVETRFGRRSTAEDWSSLDQGSSGEGWYGAHLHSYNTRVSVWGIHLSGIKSSIREIWKGELRRKSRMTCEEPTRLGTLDSLGGLKQLSAGRGSCIWRYWRVDGDSADLDVKWEIFYRVRNGKAFHTKLSMWNVSVRTGWFSSTAHG